MAFDFIDMIVNTGDEYLTGVFYKHRPMSKEDGGATFRYKQLDINAKVFGKVFGELRNDRTTYAIKTNDDCNFMVGGYIETQNGLLWEISELITNEEVEGNNETLRWFKTAKNAEISIRMVQVDDLYNLRDTYTKYCKIRIESKVKISIVTATHGNTSYTETVNANAYEYTVDKGTGWTFQIAFETGENDAIYVSADKTVVSELVYKIRG